MSVSDGALSSTATYTVNLTAANDTPTVVNTLANMSTLQDQPFRFVVANNPFADVDSGDTKTLSATLENGDPLPSWLVFDPATGTFSGTPANPDAGTISVKLTVTDARGATASTHFDLTVTAVAPPAQPVVPAPIEVAPVPSNTAAVMLSPVDPNAANTSNTAAQPSPVEVRPPTEIGGGTAVIAQLTTLLAPEVRSTPIVVTESPSGPTTITNAAALPLTSSGTNAFQVAVTQADQPALVLFKGVPDQSVNPTSGMISFTIPADAFAHTDAAAVVQLSASQANGQALPAWLAFDAAGGKFVGHPPAGEPSTLSIRMVARDAQGREAVTVFRLKLGEDASPQLAPQGEAPETTVPEPQSFLDDLDSNGKRLAKDKVTPIGRTSLSEQIRLAHRHTTASDRMPAARRVA